MKMSEQLKFVIDELPTAEQREAALYEAIDGIEQEILKTIALLSGDTPELRKCDDPKCLCNTWGQIPLH